jgi:hypothetical protein
LLANGGFLPKAATPKVEMREAGAKRVKRTPARKAELRIPLENDVVCGLLNEIL